MDIAVVTYKTSGLYVSYAPDAGVFSVGGCRDEALNNLSDELMSRKITLHRATGYERRKDAHG
jgi:hypothetical protein